MNNMKYVGDKKALWAYSLVGAFALTVAAPNLALAQIAVQGEYIVKLKSHNAGGGVSGKAGLQSKTSQFAAKMSKNFKALSAYPEMSMLSIRAQNAEDVQFLKNHPDVEFVEPNYIMSTHPTLMSEPKEADTSAFNAPAGFYGQTAAGINMNQAWGIMAQGSADKVVVAVIDSGVDVNHRVFQDTNALWINNGEYGLDANGNNKATNGVDDDGNGYVDDAYGFDFLRGYGSSIDENGHGTHVAGIVVGAGLNVLGSQLQESPIQIMSLRFLDRTGRGVTSHAISAIHYAVSRGVRVINNSWGGSSYSRALHEAYTYAYSQNVVIITAAGNDGSNLDFNPSYPAALDTPNNITVSATDNFDYRTSFSNYSSSLSHVASPGVSVMSSYPEAYCEDWYANPNQYVYPQMINGGCYATMSGTSMAAPLVAGLTALAFKTNSHLSAYQAASGIIKKSVDNVYSLNGYVSTKGRINANEVIVNATKSTEMPIIENPPYNPVFQASRSPSSTTEAPMGGCGTVKSISPSTGFGQFNLSEALILLVLLLPFVVLQILKGRSQQQEDKDSMVQRRKFARYDFSEKIKVKIKNQEFDLESMTLSLGGLSFKGAIKIEKGEKIKIMLDSVNSEIEGEVVWSAQDKKYGVKFSDVSENVIAQLKQITQGLPVSG